MIPITGPFEKVEDTSSPSPGAVFKYRKWYRQKRPYNLPLAFTSYGYKTISGTNLQDWYGSPGWGYNPSWMYAGFNGQATWFFTGPVENCGSQCRERFNSKLRDVSEMGAALGELKKSVSMISDRAGQLFRFTRKLRRFDFLGAARELNVAIYGKDGQYYRTTKKGPKKLNLRKESRAFSANFLEYSFGWAPLVGDIAKAVDIFSDPYVGQVNVTARAALRDKYVNSVNTYYPWAPVIDAASHNYSVVVKCKANVRVVNPNANLAAQMGFVNPLAVAWELVPFSFVVDYFVNVQGYLENFTSLYGLELSSVSSTTFVKDDCVATQTWWDDRMRRDCVSSYYSMSRSDILPEVTLRIKELTLPIGRALTSIALLVTLGIKK